MSARHPDTTPGPSDTDHTHNANRSGVFRRCGTSQPRRCCCGNFARATEAYIEWAGSIFLGPATNNEAEFVGLIRGLAQARAAGYTHVTIIGDSELVLNFMRHGRRPTSKTLRRHYAIAHALRKGFQECTWWHQRRHLNKMADALANMAMDLGRSTSYSSSQPLPPSISNFLTLTSGQLRSKHE